MNRFDRPISWEALADSRAPEQGGTGPTIADWEAGWTASPAESSISGAEASLGSPSGGAGGGVLTACSYLVPLHYEPNYRYPLIVWLHHAGHNERQVEMVMPHISLRNYVAVGVRGSRASDSAGHGFEWGWSPAGVDAAHEAVAVAVEEASARYSVDPGRVVLAGYRDGGTMAMRLALRDPERFSGIVSLGGPLPVCGGQLGNFQQLRQRRLPMLWQWACSGAHWDPERFATDLRTAMSLRARVEARQYADDDEMNTVTLADINAWVMREIVGGGRSSSEETWASQEVRFSSN